MNKCYYMWMETVPRRPEVEELMLAPVTCAACCMNPKCDGGNISFGSNGIHVNSCAIRQEGKEEN